MVNRVVAAKTDGTRARGYAYDINTAHEEFHLFASDAPDEAEAEVVLLRECKALYFVRSLTGNPDYEENKTELPPGRRFGRPFEVVFGDGERIVGTVEIFHPGRLGFYLVPPDPRSNNLRIFVVMANAREVRPLDAAGGRGVEGDWTAPDPVRYPAEKRVEVVMRILRSRDADALSLEVHLPVPVIHHWRDTFLAAGRDALTDEALARSRAGDAEAAPGKPDRTPPDQRLDIVLRLFARESEAVVSQVFLVPFHVMAGWRERLLDAGRAALLARAAEEAATDPDVVRSRYEALLRPPPEGEASLDADLADLFKDGEGKKRS